MATVSAVLGVSLVVTGVAAALATAGPPAPPHAIAPVIRIPTKSPRALVQPEVVVSAPCSPGIVACVQLATQHAWLLRDSRVVRDGFASSGTSDQPTPTGDFTVQWKDATHVSGTYGTPMSFSVFFDDEGDAFHEGSVGRESRGCVHLERDDAVAFFDALQPGDRVQILP